MDRSDWDTTAQDAGRPTRRARPSNITTSGVARTPGARSSGLRSSRGAVLDELVDDPETIMRGARSGRRTPAATTNAGAATAGSRQAEQASLPPTIQVDSVPQPADMSARQPEPPAPLPQTAPQVEATGVSASAAQPVPQAEPAPSRAHRSALSPVVEGISDPVPNNGSTTTRQSSPDRMDTDEVRTRPQRPAEPAWDFSQTREIPAPRDESEQRPEHREEDIGNQPAQEPPNQGSAPTREQILLEIRTCLDQIWNSPDAGRTRHVSGNTLSHVLNDLAGLLRERDAHETFELQYITLRLDAASRILREYQNRQEDSEVDGLNVQWEMMNESLRNYASQHRLPGSWAFPGLEEAAASLPYARRTQEPAAGATGQSERTEFERHTNSGNPSSRATPSSMPVTRHKLTEGQVYLDNKMWAIVCWKKQGIGHQLLIQNLTLSATGTNQEFLVRAGLFGRSAEVMSSYKDHYAHARPFSPLKYGDLKHLIREKMEIEGVVMKWDDRHLPFRTDFITQVKFHYTNQHEARVIYYVNKSDFLKHIGREEGLGAITRYIGSSGERNGFGPGLGTPISNLEGNTGFPYHSARQTPQREETPPGAMTFMSRQIENLTATLQQMQTELLNMRAELRRPPNQHSEETPSTARQGS